MTTNMRKVAAFLVIAGIGAQSARAHGGTDLVPVLLAMPLGQILSVVLLIAFAIKLHQGFAVPLIIASGSVITTILVWLFNFPLIESLIPFHPKSVFIVSVLFFLYGFVVSTTGGLIAGRIWKWMLYQHSNSVGPRPE